MSSIAKKFNQFKQWTGEKFGNERRTEASDDFKNLAAQTELRRAGIERLHSGLVTYLKTLEKKKSNPLDPGSREYPLQALGASMAAHGKFLGSESLYGEALVRAGEIEQALCCYQFDFYSHVRKSYLAQLERLLGIVKDYQYRKKKLSNRRLDYDAKLNKLQKSRREKPQLEEEVKTAKLKYEETLEDLESLMRRLAESEKELASGIFDFIQAQSDYFEKTHSAIAKGKEGLFSQEPPPTPSSFALEARESATSSLASSSSLSMAPAAPKNAPIMKAKALFDFTKDNEDELSLRKGDILDVYDEFNDGWLTGKNERNNETGMFPSNYVELLSMDNGQGHASEISTSDKQESSPAAERPGETVGPLDINSAAAASVSPGQIASREGFRMRELNEEISRMKERQPGPSSEDSPACFVCGCADFSPNVFKKNSCNNCFHNHRN